MAPSKSQWWAFFIKLDASSAKCKTCGKILKTSGNTSNLKSHIQSSHPGINLKLTQTDDSKKDSDFDNPPKKVKQKDISTSFTQPHRDSEFDNPLKKVKQKDISTSFIQPQPSTSSWSPSPDPPSPSAPVPTQKTLEDSFKTITSFQSGGRKYNEVTNSLVFMICKDNLPFKTVENAGFQHLMKTVAPHYHIPSRRTVKNLIQSQYQNAATLVKNKLSQVDSFTLTTDIWTDVQQTRSFLGMTIHFNDGEKLTTCTLGVEELEESHTSEYISTCILNLLEQWGLQKELLHSAVTDGAANMVKAIELAFGKKKHLHCFAHILNLIGQRSMADTPQLSELIDKVKRIVTWFKRSVTASDELRRSGVDLKLIQSVETRWNSTFYMLQRYLELSSSLNSIIHCHTSAPPSTTATENQILGEVMELLSPLEVATRDISGDYLTVSMAIPLATKLIQKIDSFEPNSSLGHKLKEELLSQIIKRMTGIESKVVLAIATLLDPRFKTLYFKDSEALAKAINEVKNQLKLKTSSLSPVPSSGSDSDSGSSNKGWYLSQ